MNYIIIIIIMGHHTIYLETSSLQRENVPKLPGMITCEKLGTSQDVKGFAIGSFLERVVVERANDNLC